ncbi:MAG TPA: hypothetical protein DD740_09820 [Chryseobacterium sp.]|nr:hypothetical protein [Chryseobacterium sp.]
MIFSSLKALKNKFFPTVILLSFATVVLIFVQTFRKAFRPVGYDFTCYLNSSKDFFEGKNPYTIEGVFPFIYPQFFDVIIYPFTFLPYWLAVFLWIIITYFSLFFTIKILLKIFDSAKSDFKNTLIYFSVINLLMFAILQDNFLNGQVNILLLFICTLFLKSLLKDNILLASLYLAIAISIKLTPAILLFFLLFGRNYKAFFLTSVLSIVFVIGLPYLITKEKSLEYYKYYLDTFILHRTAGEHEVTGFSLTYFFSFINPDIAIFLSVFIMLVLNFWNQMCSKIENIAVRKTILFSLYLISILLISPMSEGHHLILILPAYLFLLNLIVKNPNKLLVGSFLAVTFFLLVFKKIDFLVFITILILYFTITKLNIERQLNNKAL